MIASWHSGRTSRGTPVHSYSRTHTDPETTQPHRKQHTLTKFRTTIIFFVLFPV